MRPIAPAILKCQIRCARNYSSLDTKIPKYINTVKPNQHGEELCKILELTLSDFKPFDNCILIFELVLESGYNRSRHINALQSIRKYRDDNMADLHLPDLHFHLLNIRKLHKTRI